MRTLIRHLEQEKLYEMIVVLITVHKNECFMKGLSENMLLELVTDNGNREIKKTADNKRIFGVLELENILKQEGGTDLSYFRLPYIHL